MIVSLVWGVLVHCFVFVAGIFPSWSEPSWVGSTADWFTTVLAGIGDYGYFIPLVPIVGSLTLILAAVVCAWALRSIRMGLSLFTGGGGSAG